MAKEIGWSNESNLLYLILQKLEYITKIAGRNITTTSTTTTIAP